MALPREQFEQPSLFFYCQLLGVETDHLSPSPFPMVQEDLITTSGQLSDVESESDYESYPCSFNGHSDSDDDSPLICPERDPMIGEREYQLEIPELAEEPEIAQVRIAINPIVEQFWQHLNNIAARYPNTQVRCFVFIGNRLDPHQPVPPAHNNYSEGSP